MKRLLQFSIIALFAFTACKTNSNNEPKVKTNVQKPVVSEDKPTGKEPIKEKIAAKDAESIKRYCDQISLAKGKGQLDNETFNLEFPNIAGEMNGYSQDGKLLLMELYAEKNKQILKNSYFFQNEKPVRVIFYTFNYEGLIEVNKGNLISKEINEFFFQNNQMKDWIKNGIDHVSPLNARFVKKEQEVLQEITTMRAMLKI